ncbi:MAG: hypothetical protein ACK5XN_10695, partial [Bacteroidota bacterium]
DIIGAEGDDSWTKRCPNFVSDEAAALLRDLDDFIYEQPEWKIHHLSASQAVQTTQLYTKRTKQKLQSLYPFLALKSEQF